VGETVGEAAARRRVLIDLTPLRRSRDFRFLVSGELVSGRPGAAGRGRLRRRDLGGVP
jgi:hypothetical protein